MGVKVREKVKDSGEWWIFINHKGKRRSKKIGDKRTANTVAKGDSILDVSKKLGHHSVAFTLDRYGHWVPGEHKGQVDELDNLHLSVPYAHLGAFEEGK